jgi:hypothetical protein
MADVHIPSEHWVTLKDSALFFIPRLSEVVVSRKLTNKGIAAAGAPNRRPVSAPLVSDVSTIRRAVTHDRAEVVILALNQLIGTNELNDRDIIATVFRLNGFQEIVETSASMKGDSDAFLELLSKKTGVSKKALRHAADGGRVTGAIAFRVHAELLSEPGFNHLPLEQFADPTAVSRKEAVPSARTVPFLPGDLRLPLPEMHPWIHPLPAGAAIEQKAELE